jgi:hypothetical protein
MKTQPLAWIIIVLVLTSLACGIPGLSRDSLPPELTPVPATEEVAATIVPPTEEAPTSPTPEPEGEQKTCAELPDFQLCVPRELASALVVSTIPDNNSEESPYWDRLPEHYVIDLQGFPLTGTFLKPRIYIIPAADVFLYTEGALMTGNQLMEMMESRESHPDSLPFIPLINAGSLFTARVQYVENDQFHGVEGITQLAQDFGVINNQSLIYTFQGITNDERYWIGIILPVTQNSLPPDSSTNPLGSIEALMEQFESYTSEIEQTLDAAPADSFMPDYLTIQDVVNSISYSK